MISRRSLLASALAALTLRGQFAQAFAADPAKYNLLFPRGKWHGANLAPIGGSIDLDSGILEEMVANWEAAGRPKLPIRKTHRHLDDNVTATERLELERAYGFLTDLRATPAGLEVRTEWNAAGKAEVESGAFAFWSPEWQPQHRDRRSGEVKGWWLSGTALTNDPFFNEMPPVAASATAETTDTNPNQEQQMNPEQLKKWALSLGLSADATVEQCLKASADMGAENATLKAAKASSSDAAVITAAVAPVEAKVKDLEAKLKAEQDKGIERDVKALIATAERGDGKTGRAITPVLAARAQKIAATESVKAAEEFLTALPLTAGLAVAPIGVDSNKEGGTLTAAAAGDQLLKKRDEILAKGNISRSDALEQAIRLNPDLATAARPVASPTIQKES